MDWTEMTDERSRPFDFSVRDILRECAVMKRRGDEPAYLRIHPYGWAALRLDAKSREYIFLAAPDGPRSVNQTMCGLKVVEDPDWKAPPAVEN